MKRVLVAFTLALASFALWAANCTQYMVGAVSTTNPDQGIYGQAWGESVPDATDKYCTARGRTGCVWQRPDSAIACDANAPAGDCVLRVPGVISFGAVGWGTRTGDYCGPPPSSCATDAGTQKFVNLTIGWYRTPNKAGKPDLDVNEQPWSSTSSTLSPQTMCLEGCTWTTGNLVADQGSAWVSEEPTSSGLYRASAETRYTKTAQDCTATPKEEKQASPTQAAPECDGFVGYIDGKKTCVAKVESPPVPPRTEPVKNGNPTAGSEGGPENIPSTGNGANPGGPSSSGNGTKTTLPGGTVVTSTPSEITNTTPGTGTKTAVVGEEQLNCGAPGQPKCKIDESGTPSGSGALSAGESALEVTKSGVGTAIEQHKQLTAPSWTWTFQLPTGCTNFAMPAFNYTLDICQFQPYIHDILSIAWIMAGIFFGLSITSRALKG